MQFATWLNIVWRHISRQLSMVNLKTLIPFSHSSLTVLWWHSHFQIGITRFIWDEAYPATPCGVPRRNPSLLLMDLHYLHFGAMMFTIVLIFVVLASFLDSPPPESLYFGLTFFTRFILPEFQDEVEEDTSREVFGCC